MHVFFSNSLHERILRIHMPDIPQTLVGTHFPNYKRVQCPIDYQQSQDPWLSFKSLSILTKSSSAKTFIC